MPKLVKIKLNDIIFVDESHLLKPNAQDLLLEVIDESKITLLITKESKKADEAEESNAVDYIEIAPCTVILATDQPGALANALYKRMTIQVPLRLYRVDELKEIVEQIATKSDLLISPQAARLLAEVAHGLPRTVKHHLEGIRYFFPNSESHQLGVLDIKEFLRAAGLMTKVWGAYIGSTSTTWVWWGRRPCNRWPITFRRTATLYNGKLSPSCSAKVSAELGPVDGSLRTRGATSSSE